MKVVIVEGFSAAAGVDEGKGALHKNEALGAGDIVGQQNPNYHHDEQNEQEVNELISLDDFELLPDGEGMLIVRLSDDGLLIVYLCFVVVDGVQELLGFDRHYPDVLLADLEEDFQNPDLIIEHPGQFETHENQKPDLEQNEQDHYYCLDQY